MIDMVGRAGAERPKGHGRIRTASVFVAAILLLLPAGRPKAETGPVTLSVTASGPLPGFRAEDATRYVTQQMAASGVNGWRFVAAPAPANPPRDRIEWHFELDPYAGGGVRQFFPMAQVQKLFGVKHRISAEARLYLDGQYQTLMFGQATIQGGAEDKDLAHFVAQMTGGLLGEHGAYRSIDLSPGAIPHT
jgi:hypothetical protein